MVKAYRSARRYNMERFSNRLQRVKRLINLREPIVEGYFPKLDSLVSSRVWPARASNTMLTVRALALHAAARASGRLPESAQSCFN